MISKNLLEQIQSHLPLSSVDIAILDTNRKIILTKRTIPPYNGYWHLPGGIVQRNERMADTVKRVALQELGVSVRILAFVGCHELFTDLRHYISHLYICEYTSGEIRLDYQADNFQAVHHQSIPRHTIPSHKKMIRDAFAKLETS